MRSPRIQSLLQRLILPGIFGLSLVVFCQVSAFAGDWPQILGVHRNGIAEDETLLDAWSDDGPKLVWEHSVGEGFAGAAIKNGIAILFHRQQDQEIVDAVDLTSGKLLWQKQFPTDYQSRISSDSGPRCVPTIDQEQVYLFGAAGDLHCLKVKDGAHLWSRALNKDYQADGGYFGAGSSPLVFDKKVFVNVGGKKAGLVALDATSGKTLWAETTYQASYSSPVLIQLNDKPVITFVTRLDTVGVDPQSGASLFTFPFGERGPTVNGAIALPIDPQQIFLSASYGIGAKLVSLDDGKPKTVWENESLSSQYASAIFHDGYLYGTDGREDVGNGSLRCVDASNGKVRWSQSMSVTHLILADGKLVAWSIDGTLRLIQPEPEAYRELAVTHVFQKNARALPALSQGHLLVRSNADEGDPKFKCLLIGK
jgi:outer membrane protein assembly factor BamB